jgi:hypothetical protein
MVRSHDRRSLHTRIFQRAFAKGIVVVQVDDIWLKLPENIPYFLVRQKRSIGLVVQEL